MGAWAPWNRACRCIHTCLYICVHACVCVCVDLNKYILNQKHIYIHSIDAYTDIYVLLYTCVLYIYMYEDVQICYVDI